MSDAAEARPVSSSISISPTGKSTLAQRARKEPDQARWLSSLPRSYQQNLVVHAENRRGAL